MDYQNRAGSKRGSGGVEGDGLEALKRKERVKQLVTDSSLVAGDDAHIHRISANVIECRLCLTIHNSESSYLTHTLGKTHKTKVAEFNALKAAKPKSKPGPKPAGLKPHSYVKIGNPNLSVVKLRDPESKAFGLLLKINCPRIASGIEPQYRFMSCYEQQVEKPKPQFQYLVISIEPYNTIAVKIPSQPIDTSSVFSYFNAELNQYCMQFLWPADTNFNLFD